MILLPTKGRPQSIERFAAQYRLTQGAEPVLLLVDEGDASYDTLSLPPEFSIMKMAPHKGIVECVNRAFARYPNLDYYGIMADDVVPQTAHWDKLMKQACIPYGISWGNDGLQGGALPTHPFLGGDLVRRMGWIVCPKFNHWFADTMCNDLADAVGIGHYLPDVHVPHYHVFNDLASLDDTYLNQPSRERDHEAYQKFHREEFPALVAKLKSFKP